MPGIHLPTVVGILVGIGLLSLALASPVRTAEAFFRASDEEGGTPGVLMLTFSQVTTWIFARSLLNAGLLGYTFGIAGALAYTTYYGSFLTGWLVVDRLRFTHGADNIQGFLETRFGRLGTACFNLLIALRLVSEVFANLLVVGIVFAGAGANTAILAVVGLTLLYAMTGGLRASLRTDVVQTAVLILALGVLVVMTVANPLFDGLALIQSTPNASSPAWALLVVALLQVLSYPMHDPVMMDRGFLADRETTRRSFLHAFWISALCIFSFGLVGAFAGLHQAGGEELLGTLERLLGTPAMVIVGIALVLSAASTMDSVLSSASKLVVVDMKLVSTTPRNGRWAMVLFCVTGLALVFLGTEDLFAAVAVSGTASLFLAPVIVFCILADREVDQWSFLGSFTVAMAGAGLYFLEDSGYITLVEQLTGLAHGYDHLLIITGVMLIVGFLLFVLGLKSKAPVAELAVPHREETG